MKDPRALTRADILRAASTFRSQRKTARWTVVVESRELPARPLVLEAAGVPPNNPTNSHQAVAILERLGFETRYATDHSAESSRLESTSSDGEEETSLAEVFSAIAGNVPESEWRTIPTDLSKNIDRYLYGKKVTR